MVNIGQTSQALEIGLNRLSSHTLVCASMDCDSWLEGLRNLRPFSGLVLIQQMSSVRLKPQRLKQ